MTQAAIIALAVWTLVLTVITTLVIRQIALLTVRLDRGANDSAGGLGLMIGDFIPPTVESRFALPRHYVLLLDATCGPCHQVAESLQGRELPVGVIAAIGGDQATGERLAEAFPLEVEVVTGPAADAVKEAFGTSVSPVAYQVENRKVTGRALLTNPEDFFRFAATRDLWDEHEERVMEVGVYGNGRN